MKINQSSLEYLHNSKGIPKKYHEIYNSIVSTIESEEIITNLKTRQNRFVLDQSFYSTFINLEFYDQLKNTDKQIYDCFEYCINNNYFDQSSIKFPLSKVISKINKYHKFLQEEDFWIIDKIDEFIEFILKDNKNKEEIDLSLFIILTLFNSQKIAKNDISKINIKNSFMRNNCLYLIIFYGNMEEKFIPFKVIQIDHEYSSYVNKMLNDHEVSFNTEYKKLINKSREKIKDFFASRSTSRYHVRKAIINKHLYSYETPIVIALKFQKIKINSLILHELEYLKQNSIPKKFLEIERNNLEFKKSLEKDDEFDDFNDQLCDNSGFDYELLIKPLFYFTYKQKKLFLLNYDNATINKLYIEHVLNNFNEARDNIINNKNINEVDDESILLVLNFMIIYLEKLIVPKPEKIEFSTFKQYLSLIKNNFLIYYDDIKTFDEINLGNLVEVLQVNEHKKSSTVNKVVGLINNMVKLDQSNAIRNKLINTMSKSMVFKNELDIILENIYKYYEDLTKKFTDRVLTKKLQYIILQEQVLVLLLFYTGLRKTELRTRLHSDLINEEYYIYTGEKVKNGYTLYVNLDGIKKDKTATRLKTSNAKRKVNFYIENEEHAKKIKDFLVLSKKHGKRYIFKEVKTLNSRNKSLEILSTALKYSNFLHLNNIIKSVTKRYATIHSLRASFATYRFKEILENPLRRNTDMFNLAVEMGHQTPITTLLYYIHYHVIKEL